MNAAEVMDPDPSTLKPTDTIGYGAEIIMHSRYRSLPVVDDNFCYLGMFGVNCLLKQVIPKAVLMHKGLENVSFIHESMQDLYDRFNEVKDQPISICMSHDIHAVAPDTPLTETLLQLYETKTSIPVVEPDSCKLLGMISYFDVGSKILNAEKTPMHDIQQAEVILGLSPQWLAGSLFILTYVLIVTERMNRAVVAMMAAVLMILSGVLTQQSAMQGVDINTIGLLTGMMIIVGITRESGVFQYLAIRAAKLVRADPWGILVMLMLVTALLSALLDNVTTVLLIAPITLLITDTLKISAYPFLFTEIFASNIGGTATLIGDPPNIMIGSATGLGYNDFLFNLAPIAVFILLLTLIPVYLIWGRHLKADPELKKKVMKYRELDAIKDWALLKKSLFVLALVMLGFILGHDLGLQPATIAMFGAALLLALYTFPFNQEKQSQMVYKSLCNVEWITIFFFMGLFILVYGVETTGLLEMLAHKVLDLTGGDKTVTALSILFVSATASAIIDNIPFVATMIPMIKNMAATFGGSHELVPLWWSLALGSCLGGNGSLVGASANLIVAGYAERSGQPIRFLPFMMLAFPMMMASVCVSGVYVYLRYL